MCLRSPGEGTAHRTLKEQSLWTGKPNQESHQDL
jgi:hypothetical protein